jgi:hypothetical protein
VRGKDNKEISLETFQAFRDPRGMRKSVMKNMVLGISSRNYEEAVEGFVKGYGIKKTSEQAFREGHRGTDEGIF